jgi:hypothetical protein
MAAIAFSCSRGLQPTTRSGQLRRRPAERCEILGRGGRGDLVNFAAETFTEENSQRVRAGEGSGV